MKGRIATAAHPLCTCREHDHQLDAEHCVGTRLYFRATHDGSLVQGECRVLGGIEPRTREACVMHGPVTSDGRP